MNKLKLFIDNFFVYGLGGIISKIIPMIMIPIIARIMPNSSYYGISDLNSTIVSFGSALAIMGMYDAMFRLFFDKEDDEYKKRVCSTAITFTLITSFITAAIVVLLKDLLAKYIFGDIDYSFLVYLSSVTIFVSATNGIISAPTRMQNKRKIFLIMNTLSPLLSYGIAIPLLLKGYYIIALPLSGFIAGLSSELIFYFLNRKWFQLNYFNFNELKMLLKIGLPTVPGFIFYWVFNSSDRIMISNIIDTAATGIYSVGAKLGMVSHLLYTAFAGGWQYFAFATMKEDNQVESNSRIFEYLGILSFICSSLVFVTTKLIYKILFVGEYVEGYIVAPYLFLAPLLQMLYQVIGNQFLLVKNTIPSMFILMVGAIINIALNFMLISHIGIEGAAISSLVGYAVSVIIAVIVLLRMKLIVVKKRFIIASLLMIGYILLWRFLMMDYMAISFFVSIIFSVVLLTFYRKDMQLLLKRNKKS